MSESVDNRLEGLTAHGAACIALISSLVAASGALADVAGVWRGTYQCLAKSRDLTLTVNAPVGRPTTAVFEFVLPETGEVGRFEMSGTFEPRTGRMTLNPVRWLKRPPRYGLIGLRGQLSRGGDLLSGSVTNPSCSSFSLRRDGGSTGEQMTRRKPDAGHRAASRPRRRPANPGRDDRDPKAITFKTADWTVMRKVPIASQPVYFDYVDGAERSLSADARRKSIRDYHRTFGQGNRRCARRVELSGQSSVASFSGLPSGKSWLVVTCEGRCEDLKYSVATGYWQIFQHAGLSEEYPVLMFNGPPTYFHRSDVRFVFFQGRDAVPAGQPAGWRPTLPSDTRVAVTHWETSFFNKKPGPGCFRD